MLVVIIRSVVFEKPLGLTPFWTGSRLKLMVFESGDYISGLEIDILLQIR